MCPKWRKAGSDDVSIRADDAIPSEDGFGEGGLAVAVDVAEDPQEAALTRLR